MKNFIILFLFFILYNSICFGKESPVSIIRIECENKINPSGVSVRDLHFGWLLGSTIRNQFQKEYRIVISSNFRYMENDKYDVYDSKWVKSSLNSFIKCKGDHLRSGEKYFWKVKIKDSFDYESKWSEPGEFITSLESSEDWNGAKWIGFEDMTDSMILFPGIHGSGDGLGNKAVKRPVTPLLRTKFSIDKKVVNAIIFISGLGHYELYCNGLKIGNDFLQPGWTEYNKTCYFNTYDITNSINKGENVLGVILGNGFYNINREGYRKLVIAYGMPKMICQLKITYEDGSIQYINSDSGWKTAKSPIEYNSIYSGEQYDARLEQSGWNAPSFNDFSWQNAIHVNPPKGILKPQLIYPLKIMESFTQKEIINNSNGSNLYDFGQNLSGIIELKVKGKKGQKINLTPCEIITKNNLVNQNASGKPYNWTYILKSDSIETWQPKFSYYGFRYVLVEDASRDSLTNDDSPKIISLKSLHTRNSAPQVGIFECSNKLFNKISELINWAIKSNFASVITDCPHREKLGWLEQTHLMGEGIHFNFDIYNLYKKQIEDMIDCQTLDGLVPDIAPEYVVFTDGFRDSPEWGSASILLPYLVYKWYGDTDIIKKAYPMMKKYVNYLQSKSSDNILFHGLGDWCDLGPNFPGEAQLTPKELTATAFYFYDVLILSKMAELINQKNDAENLRNLSDTIRNAFNTDFRRSDNRHRTVLIITESKQFSLKYYLTI